MRRIVVAVLALFLLAAFFPCPSRAGERYVVGVEALEYLPHYSGLNQDFTGYARDLLDAFADYCGCELVYRPLPVKRLYEAFFVTREVDFKFPDYAQWRPEYRQGLDVAYSDPLGYYVGGTLVRPENKGRGLKALHSLGTLLGFTPVEYLEPIQAGRLTLVEVPVPAPLLHMGLSGRVDGVNLDVAVARYHLAHTLGRPNALVFDPDLPYVHGPFLMSTIKYPEVIQKLNRFLQEKADLVEELRQEHGVVVDTEN